MTIAAVEIQPLAVDVAFSADMLQVELADGRAIGVPLEWFPDLEAASAEGPQELGAHRRRPRHTLGSSR